MEPRTKLLDHMRNVMRLKHMSLRTEEAYISWVKRFILFHDKRHPAAMGADDIRAFLTHLAVHGKVAASTQNGALNALVFLYRQVLKQPFPELEGIERAKRRNVSQRFLRLTTCKPSWHSSVARRASWRVCSTGRVCVSWNGCACV
jgi:site-specific recombinase XerD